MKDAKNRDHVHERTDYKVARELTCTGLAGTVSWFFNSKTAYDLTKKACDGISDAVAPPIDDLIHGTRNSPKK